MIYPYLHLAFSLLVIDWERSRISTSVGVRPEVSIAVGRGGVNIEANLHIQRLHGPYAF